MKRALIMTLAAALTPMAFGQEAPATNTVAAPATTTTSTSATSPAVEATTSPTTESTTGPTRSATASTQTSDRYAPDRVSERYGSRDVSRGSRRSEGDSTPHASAAFPVASLKGTQYATLESRSMFYKGHFDRTEYENNLNRPTGTTNYVPPPAVAPPIERSLVFEGATMFDDEYVAFIEDFTQGKVQMLKTGDAIGTGKVGMISLNSMEFVGKGNKVTAVSLGRNLEGGEAPSTRPSYMPASDATNSTAIGSTSSSPGNGLTGATESIAEKLRRKRQAELGGGN